MIRIRSLIALFAVAVAGCAGSGSSTFAPTSFTPSAVPANRIAFMREFDATTDELVSINPDGTGLTAHARIPYVVDVWDVDAAGSKLLAVTRNADGVSSDVRLIGLDGAVAANLTNVQFEAIESVRFSGDYKRFVASGTANGGAPMVVMGNADGSGQSVVLDVATLAIFTSTGTLAIGGETTDPVPQPFVGLMTGDGATMTSLVKRVQPIDIDESGGTIVYSASVGGDASGVTALFGVGASGGAPTALYAATSGIDSDPKISKDGSLVYFFREGAGLMSVPITGGTPKTVFKEINLTRLLRSR